MFDIHITINSFIPESLRTKALEVTIEALITLGEGILEEELLARAGAVSATGSCDSSGDGISRPNARFSLLMNEKNNIIYNKLTAAT